MDDFQLKPARDLELSPRQRWTSLRLRIGAPLLFDHLENRRAGWAEISARCREAVIGLSEGALV